MSVRVPLGDLRHVEFDAVPEVEMRHFRTRPDLWQTPIRLWRDPDGVSTPYRWLAQAYARAADRPGHYCRGDIAMTVPSDFMELSDERGQAVAVCCGEVAAVRDMDPTIGYMRSVLVLKSGETIALQTEFKTVIERMKGK